MSIERSAPRMETLPFLDRRRLLAGLAGSAAVATLPRPARADAPAPARCDENEREWFTDTELVDQTGRTVRFYSDVLSDRTVIANFIFTSCQDACPLTTARLLAVSQGVRDHAGRPVRLVSISVDPETDTPPVLTTFAKRMGEAEDWMLLTGERAAIDRVVSRLGQKLNVREDHTVLLLAGNVSARRWAKVTPMETPEEVTARLKALAAFPPVNSVC